MRFQPKVYTIGHVLGMCGMVIFGTVACYQSGTTTEDSGLRWFTENWLLYIGAGATILTFLFGLTILGTPWYDEKTNKQLEAEHNRAVFEHNQAVFEWNSKSPEERAILNAAEENRLLQLTQIIQNNQILQNQEQAKPKRRY